ncbi:MAG: superoxide dismutase family protein [Phycisphaerales bacterium]|nr:superoxide dismutase family protein [Hyphomonadaceae bacterium]
MRPIAALLFAALLTACATAPSPDPAAGAIPTRTAWIVGANGRAIGQAHFTAAPRGTLIRLEFSAGALPPGWHGLHLHTRGDCSDFAAGFQASGGHLGMSERVQHGLLNPAGPEAGDLPNVFATPAGPFAAEIFSPHTVLGAQRTRNPAREALLDADGTALLIHASADDQTSQPIGGAGARIACVALTPLP